MKRTAPSVVIQLERGLSNGTLKVALMDPLNSTRIDELGFVVKKDLQLVIADPAQVEKGLEKYYPDGVEDSDTVSPDVTRTQNLFKKNPIAPPSESV